MEFRASHRFARISPRKARDTLRLIQGKRGDQALAMLAGAHNRRTGAVRTRAAGFVAKVLESALANALDPSLELRTAEVHAGTGKGVHTTTTVSLLRLPWGGYLVDTPGIREFGLWDMELREVGFWFREIEPLLDDCRFNDCLHEAEPNCAVKEAAAGGAVAEWRYSSYLRILQTLREGTPEDY